MYVCVSKQLAVYYALLSNHIYLLIIFYHSHIIGLSCLFICRNNSWVKVAARQDTSTGMVGRSMRSLLASSNCEHSSSRCVCELEEIVHTYTPHAVINYKSYRHTYYIVERGTPDI